jgi:hypothetical protein
MEKLPIYRFVVSEDDEAEVTAVALVNDPAIELNWIAFSQQFETGKLVSNDYNKYSFKADKEKRIISGALMVADLPIYRRDASGFEYYGLFTSEDIYNIRNKFFKKGYINEVNKMHDPNQFVDGVYMIESFIIDSKRGINAPDGLQLPDGSWFGSYKVDNEEVWNNFIKTGEFKGFSVEGDFRLEKLGDKPLTTIEQMIDIIKQIDDHNAKQKALNELNTMVKTNINIQ